MSPFVAAEAYTERERLQRHNKRRDGRLEAIDLPDMNSGQTEVPNGQIRDSPEEGTIEAQSIMP
jgi:hypothetical protein